MSDRPKGLLARLVDAGTRAAASAATQVMSDPRGQEAVARALGAAQRGMKTIEGLQARAMKAAGIPGRQDYQELAKQLARIKRKARDLAAAVDGGRAPGPAAREEPAAPGDADADPERSR
jgi:hypothetical protein